MKLEGTKLSHYRLLGKLGEGGFGEVYRAEDVRLGRTVALKVLQNARSVDPRTRRRFLDEARAASALDHPHICQIYEYDESDSLQFLVMQFVEGETLKSELLRAPLAEDRVGEVVGAVASALAAAHARGIIHRDVKSENILIGKDGGIKLTDFGLARLTENAVSSTSHGVMGTPAYLSPEQLEGRAAGPEADQFSLAVVAYECLTGVLPFGSENLAAVMYAIANVDPLPPSRRRPGLGNGWDSTVQRALAKDPAARFASITDFAEAVRAGVGSTEAASTRSGPKPGSIDGAPAASASRTGRPSALMAAATSTSMPSIAVLFFENLSNDPESDYFCSGIHEDILTDLSKVPGLRVASRNAVARFRGGNADLQQIAAELGVGAVVEGKVRRSEHRVRITAQLVDASNGFQLWAERYDRTLEDVFAVQEDIARRIADALGRTLTPAQTAELMRGRPADVEAYDLYLRGRQVYRLYTAEDNRRALEYFERAVTVDPRYALAWSGIADCCAQMHDKGWDPDPQWQRRGFEAARRSIELDPTLPEGHKAEALLWTNDREPAHAIQALERALEADPGYTPALINLGQEMLCAGDFAAAERYLRRAIKADPAYGLAHLLLAIVFLYTRRYRASIETTHRAQKEGASVFFSSYAYAMRAHAFAEDGNPTAAESEISGGRAAGVSEPMLLAAEALLRAQAGDPDRAAEILGSLERRPPEESYGCELCAGAAGRLGEAAAAVRFLRAAEAVDPRHPSYWRVSPNLAPVRETREFRECLGDRGRRLVWPAEAPPLPAGDRAQFTEYGEASGMPEGRTPTQ